MDQNLINTINLFFKGTSVTYAAIFGSVAKGNTNNESDIDILFDYDKSKRMSLFDLIDLKHNLQSKLRKEVDLVPIGGLKPEIKTEVISSAVTVYEK